MQNNDDKSYLIFVLGYDLLNSMYKYSSSNECDVSYEFSTRIIDRFMQTDDYKNKDCSIYKALEDWIYINKDSIEEKYKEFVGIKDNRHRKLDGGIYIIDVGYRREQPIALIEKSNDSYKRKEYIIAFNYEINDNKISWGYGSYYENKDNAIKDYKRVFLGENLYEKDNEMEEQVNKEYNFYDENEISQLLNKKEKLVYADNGVDEVIIRYCDIPDFIIDTNTDKVFGSVDWKIYDYDNYNGNPILTTKGEYLDKCNPKVRADIIDRLVKLQTNEASIKEYKIINEDILEKVINNMERKQKNKERDDR